MAAERQSVPKFGEWTDDVPFTVMFEKASRSSSRKTNKSNPKEYPDMNPTAAQTRNQRHDQPANHNVRSRQERSSSREETYNYQSYGGRGSNPSETSRRQPYDPTPVQPRPIHNLRGRRSERVATIPPFPGSGPETDENYTFIFDNVKENKRQSETVRSYNETDHSTPTRVINKDDQHHKPLPSSPKGCCFPRWGRK